MKGTRKRMDSPRPRLLLFALAVFTPFEDFGGERTKFFAMPAVRALNPAVLVTGSTDGIGLTTAKHMASGGYNVLIHGRDADRIERSKMSVERHVKERRSRSAKNDVDVDVGIWTLPPADLSTVDGCTRLASHVQDVCRQNDLQLSVLMNNAGVYSGDHVVTSDGTELTFAVNVVAPFVITSLLLPALLSKGSERIPRIVIASSISQCYSIRNWDDLAYQKRPYSPHGAYSESKLFDAMLTMEMAERLQKDGGLGTDRVTCNCLDPGTVNTKMLLDGWGPIGIDVNDALDQMWLCSSEEVESVTGKYFVYQSERRASSSAYEPEERRKMWSLLSELAPEAAAMWKFDWL